MLRCYENNPCVETLSSNLLLILLLLLFVFFLSFYLLFLYSRRRKRKEERKGGGGREKWWTTTIGKDREKKVAGIHRRFQRRLTERALKWNALNWDPGLNSPNSKCKQDCRLWTPGCRLSGGSRSINGPPVLTLNHSRQDKDRRQRRDR